MEILLVIFIVLIIVYYSIDYYLSNRLKKHKYNQFIDELRTHSNSKFTHYFGQTCLKQLDKEDLSIELIEFFIKLDIYYSNVDLQTLIYHRAIYIKNNPNHSKVIDLYNRLVSMKSKDYLYNIH